MTTVATTAPTAATAAHPAAAPAIVTVCVCEGEGRGAQVAFGGLGLWHGNCAACPLKAPLAWEVWPEVLGAFPASVGGAAGCTTRGCDTVTLLTAPSPKALRAAVATDAVRFACWFWSRWAVAAVATLRDAVMTTSVPTGAGVWFWLSRREVAYRGVMTYVTCTMVGSTPALLATATCTSRMVWANDGLVDTTLGSSAGSVIQTAGR